MYSQDYNLFAGDFLPSNYRTAEDIAWVQKALLSQMTRAEQIFFHDYMYGVSVSSYDIATTYNTGDRVSSGSKVYESVADTNLAQSVDNGDWWVMILPDFVGVYERIRYDSTKLRLEFALNKRYGGTFVQPSGTSDIYITKNATSVRSFLTGNTEEASAVGVTTSTGYVGNTTINSLNTGFTVNIPTALVPAGGVTEVTNFVTSIVRAHAIFDINVI